MFIFMVVYDNAGGKQKRLTDISHSRSYKLPKNCVITEAFSVVFLFFFFASCHKQYDSKRLINRNRKIFLSLLALQQREKEKKNSSLIITFCFCLIRFYYWITQSDCIDFHSLPASLWLSMFQAACIYISKFICANKADKSM
jgi:hypothetical protein